MNERTIRDEFVTIRDLDYTGSDRSSSIGLFLVVLIFPRPPFEESKIIRSSSQDKSRLMLMYD